MDIRLLSFADSEDVQRLLEKKDTLLKEPIQEGIPAERMVRLIQEPSYRVYGAFLDGQLIGVGTAELWIRVPYYSIANFFLEPGRTPAEYRDFSVKMVDQMMFDMEAEGRFQFYMLTLFRPYQKKALLEGQLWEFPKGFTCFDRYDVTIETVVKAHEKAIYATHVMLMGDKTWSSDIWIRKGVLKIEYQSEYWKKLVSSF